MVPVTILQSYQQGVSVWGEPGMAALWGAATRKVIGAGIDDPRLARDLATLVGRHDVPGPLGQLRRWPIEPSRYPCDGRTSSKRPISEPSPGTALLLATGARPALIRLRPWYAGPQTRADRRGHPAGRGCDAARCPERDAKPAGRPGSSSGQRHANSAGKQLMTTQVPGSGPDEDRDEGGSHSRSRYTTAYEAWVTGQFLPMYRRPLGGEYRWCRSGGSTPRPSPG